MNLRTLQVLIAAISLMAAVKPILAQAPPVYPLPVPLRNPEPNDGVAMHFGRALLPGQFGFGNQVQRSWGKIDRGAVLIRLRDSEFSRHQVLVAPATAFISDWFLGHTPLGPFSAGTYVSGLPLSSCLSLYWYPAEGVAVIVGLDPLRGWKWGIDFFF